MYTIGQIAKQVGLTRDTLRLYERYQLIPPPVRKDNGYRYYTKDDIKTLTLIKQTKAMGFTLKEIADILVITQSSDHPCDRLYEKVQSKIQVINQKISELSALKNHLSHLAQRCPEHKQDQCCPIIDELNINTPVMEENR